MNSTRCFVSAALLVFLTQVPALATTTILDTTPVAKESTVPGFYPRSSTYPNVERMCAIWADVATVDFSSPDSENSLRVQREAKNHAGDLYSGTRIYLIKVEKVRCSPDPEDKITGKYMVHHMGQARVTDPKSLLNGKIVWLDLNGPLF